MRRVFKKEELEDISCLILEEVLQHQKKGASLLALSGDLGVGKTTITQVIARKLGIKEKIISPTFVIMKIYETDQKSTYYKNFKKLIHIDAYRLANGQELKQIGWTEMLKDKNSLIIIEWPEIVKDVLDKDVLWVKLSHIDEEARSLEF